MTRQPSLFEPPPPNLPEGLVRRAEVLTEQEEAALVARLSELPVKPFEFRGFLGKRRVASFGWRYDFNGGGLERAGEIPPYLRAVRESAAALAGATPDELEHVLVTQYQPGAAIGWHRDRPEFGDVVGVSLLSPCLFRLRRRSGAGWERAGFTAEPRSAYLLSGPARYEWEHSIPPVQALRWSVTFRRLRAG